MQLFHNDFWKKKKIFSKNPTGLCIHASKTLSLFESVNE